MIEPGTLLQNRYRVVRQVGAGGMGAVYFATDERFQSTVAIKQTFFDDPNLRKAFEREAHLLNHLRHGSLPKVSDHFEEGPGQFLVMEYIEGQDFSEMLRERGGAFPVADVLRWADELLDALDYLHTHEPPVVHRDIKPQNMKLTARGHVVLLDFGLAKGSTQAFTQATANQASVFGYSPTYAPLEQIQGTGTDARSDLYSLAATLYHLLTGKAPTDALTRATAVINHQPDPLRPAHAAHAQVPAAVGQLIQRALSLKAALRPGTAAEMRAALRRASGAPEVLKPPAPAPRKQAGPSDPTLAGTVLGDAQTPASVSRTFRPAAAAPRHTERTHGETTVVDDVTKGAAPRGGSFRPAPDEFGGPARASRASSAALRGALVAAVLAACALAVFTLARGRGAPAADAETQTPAPSPAPAEAAPATTAAETQPAANSSGPSGNTGNVGAAFAPPSARTTGPAPSAGAQAARDASATQTGAAQPPAAGGDSASAGSGGRGGLVIQQPVSNLPPDTTGGAAEEARRAEESRRADEARRSEEARRRQQDSFQPAPEGRRPPPPDGRRPPPPHGGRMPPPHHFPPPR